MGIFFFKFRAGNCFYPFPLRNSKNQKVRLLPLLICIMGYIKDFFRTDRNSSRRWSEEKE